jgi:hypothetical protein
MSTTSIVRDCRNTAQRNNILENPFWISSAVLDASVAPVYMGIGLGPGMGTGAIDDKYCLLFSFPTAGQNIIIRQFCTEVITPFTAGTTGIVGTALLADDSVTYGGVATDSDNNQIEATGTTYTTAGKYYSATGAALAARILGIPTVGSDLIIGAATSVPVIVATFANASTIAAGTCRYHMEISIVPQG